MLSFSARIGNNFNVLHRQGLIVNSKTRIGNNVSVRQNTTIGNSKSGGACPVIADNLEVGANAVVNKSFLNEGATLVGIAKELKAKNRTI